MEIESILRENKLSFSYFCWKLWRILSSLSWTKSITRFIRTEQKFYILCCIFLKRDCVCELKICSFLNYGFIMHSWAWYIYFMLHFISSHFSFYSLHKTSGNTISDKQIANIIVIKLNYQFCKMVTLLHRTYVYDKSYWQASQALSRRRIV